MKIEVLRDNFKKSLATCERITRKSLTLPVLQNVFLSAAGNLLELTTTNLETTIRCWILAKIEKVGKLITPASFLSNLVSLVNDEKIGLSADKNELSLALKSESIQIKIQGPEDFPIIPKVGGEILAKVNSNNLANILQFISDIPSFSQVRPEISGVYFNFNKDKLKVVGTDSFRLGEKTAVLANAVVKENFFILPQSSAKELFNIASQEQAETNIYLDKNQILFEFLTGDVSRPKIHLMSRLIEGSYPNYQEIIPKKFTLKIQANKNDFENQLKKAGLFSGKTMGVKLTIDKKSNGIKIFSQNIDLGSGEAFLPCSIEGEDLSISFNYKFLLDGLQSIKGSEVVLSLSGPDGPGVLRPVGDATYFYILMPIKN